MKLNITHPEVAKEWHPTKNGDLKPTDVTYGSNKRVWWQCSKGHEWQTKVGDRIAKGGTGCPYCSNRKILKGYNDLETTHPEVAKEWHPTKNGDLKPTDVTYGSRKRVWWQCSKGHEWQTKVADRIVKGGTGCPHCSNERKTSFSELAIFYYLNKCFKDAIHRHKTKSNKEVDIYIPSLKLGIEYDGYYWHKDKVDKDTYKSIDLCKNMTLLRIREIGLPKIDVDNCFNYIVDLNRMSLDKSIEWIFNFIENKYKISCNKYLNIDTSVNESNILSLSNYLEKENSLKNNYPEISKEWHPSKNSKLKPSHVTCSSAKKVWWQCSKGHEWQALIINRVNGAKCPYCCNKKVLKGFNDLATTHPEIAKEWHPTKNGDLKPTDVTYGSGKNVWWVCSKTGIEYQKKVLYKVKCKSTF